MVNVSLGRNDNERTVLKLIRAMELGTLDQTMDELCSPEFIWANSGLSTIYGLEQLRGHMTSGGFANDIPILKDMTHFSAELLNLASDNDIVFTERLDHHWDKSGRDLMTTHICGVSKVVNGKILSFRDFYDVACYEQKPGEIKPDFELQAFRHGQKSEVK